MTRDVVSVRGTHEGAPPPRCPFCHASIDAREAVWLCPACRTTHHVDCAGESRACSVYGCGATARFLVRLRTPRKPGALAVRALGTLALAIAAA